MAVQAYCFRYLKGNDLMPSNQGANVFDGIMVSPLLETLNIVGVDAFTMGKPIFVPISSYLLLSGVEKQCAQDPESVIFLLESDMRADDEYIEKIKQLQALGYRIALQGAVSAADYTKLITICDFLFIDVRESAGSIVPRDLKNLFRNLGVVAMNIDTADQYSQLLSLSYDMYEGRFFRAPLTKGNNAVSPLKVNLISLLNAVQDEDFEFTEITRIIQRDTALTISLMKMVNSPYLGLKQQIKTINHAVAMLGMREVRKWAITAVSRSMGADRPDEITRLSLLRAKFAENLASKMNMSIHSQGLFLTGLFSVIDVVLELTMDEALKIVRVSDTIRNALVDKRGIFYPVMELIERYENADWQAVSRLMIIYDLLPSDMYKAYIDSLVWYRELLAPPVDAEDEKKAAASFFDED